MSLFEAGFSAHSALLLAEEIAQIIQTGSTAVVFVRDASETHGIYTLVRKRLQAPEIKIVDVPATAKPLEAIYHVVASRTVEQYSCSTLEEALRHPGLPQAICVRDIPPGRRAAWMALASEWAIATRPLADRGIAPSLLVITVPPPYTHVTPPVKTTLGLQVVWWWATPSIAELRLMCRGVSARVAVLPPEIRWREAIVPSLALTDLTLADAMSDKVIQGKAEEIVSFLIGYGKDRGWSKEKLSTLDLPSVADLRDEDKMPCPDPASSRFADLWQMGVLCWTPEHGTEVHSAALALIGDNRAVGIRAWRAQCEVLLPLLEFIRIKVCESISTSQERTWPYRNMEPYWEDEKKAVRDDPLSTQYAHLFKLLLYDTTLWLEKKRFIHVVRFCQQVRNNLAHGNPVSYFEYSQTVTMLPSIWVGETNV